MNILMVCNGVYPDEIGGAHTYIYELARHLAARGHRLTMLTRRAAPELPPEEVIEGVRYVRYNYREGTDPVRWRYRLYFGARRGFNSLAEHEQFDVIHGHWPHSAAGVFDHPASGNSLKVYTLHAPFFEEERVEAAVLRREHPFALRQLIKSMWVPISLHEKRHREHKVLERSSVVFVLSRFMKKRAKDYFNVSDNRLHVVPGGVDTRRFHPADNREAIRAKLGIPAEREVLLTVRRLVPRMGLKNVVRAMAAVRLRKPQALLCIGGAGPLYGEIGALIRQLSLSDCVRLLGFIRAEELADWYRAADYFVMPSEFLEGFGLSTLEAMACGTPVLGTPVGGTGEILGRIDRRLLFPGPSPHDMAESILYHMEKRTASKLREKVASYASRVYAWDTVVEGIERLLLSKLRESGCR